MDRESNDTVAGQPESYVPLRYSCASNNASKHSRAISSVAQNFATDLDSLFGLSPGLATLSQTVEEKKASVSSGQSELEQLEVRLRATEERLAKVSRSNSPARPADGGADDAHPVRKSSQTSPLAQRPTYPADRPPTAPRRAAPPPPSEQETQGQAPGDYVMVDRTAQARSE